MVQQDILAAGTAARRLEQTPVVRSGMRGPRQRGGIMAGTMSLRRRSVVLSLLALFVAPGMLSASMTEWRCEGRICSKAATFCCCEAPGSRDRRCATPRPTLRSRQTACRAACSCVLTISAASHARIAPRMAGPLAQEPAALLAASPFVAAPAIALPLPVAPRGPPAAFVDLPPVGLRAPPTV